MNIQKRNFFVFCMALVITIAMSSNCVLAAEVSNCTDISDANDGIVPYGSLSGYVSQNIPINISKEQNVYIPIEVSGSWSPWAGCTLKTSGFPENTQLQLRVCYHVGPNDGSQDVEKIGWKSFGPSTEYTNIPMINVEPGNYRIYIEVIGNTGSGTVECWIY